MDEQEVEERITIPVAVRPAARVGPAFGRQARDRRPAGFMPPPPIVESRHADRSNHQGGTGIAADLRGEHRRLGHYSTRAS